MRWPSVEPSTGAQIKDPLTFIPGEIMSKNIATMALAAALATTTIVSTASADPGRGRHYGNHHAHNHGHRGRGHYRNGKWIALGILGAAAAAAIANSDNDDCYYRRGRRYCR
jgi:hypothetical protein